VDSVGYADFEGQLSHNISAHPKVDKKTGELITFGYDLFGGDDGTHLKYSLFDKNNELKNTLNIPISGPVMIHDIAITEQYVVFNDLPMEFKPEGIAMGNSAFQFNKEVPAKYGIMKRDCQDTADIKWFELPNHYVFHFANAWEKTAPNGDEMVVMFGCALKDVNLKHSVEEKDGSEHPFLWEDDQNDNRGKLTKFEFNLTTGESSMKLLVDEASDFPLIDFDIMGYES
jgi:carotenoid cleavage dioxygenase